MAAADPHVFLPRQFANPENAEAHRLRTGPEMTGPGRPAPRRLRRRRWHGRHVDGRRARRCGLPAATSLLSPGCAWPTGHADAEQGGPCAGIPGVVECMSSILDETLVGLGPDIVVTHDDAMIAARELIAQGFPVGLSSGLNLRGAASLAATLGPGKHVGTVFCDRMERYFSTELFDDLR